MRKMNKILSLALSLVLVTSLAACGGNASNETTKQSETAGQTEDNNTGGNEGSLKTGLAVVTSMSSSKDAGDADGTAQIDSTAIALLVDADGKIADIAIDAAQTRVNFDSTGKVTTDKASEFKTKRELGADYGMVGNSDIGKEWFEQMDALEELVTGKTAAEVAGLELDEGKLVDATSSVTVTATGYLEAIALAFENAEDLGAKAGDSIKLGIQTSVSGSHDVGANERTPDAGKVEAYTFYAALSVDSSDTITSAIIDASQGAVTFDAAGAITSDLSAKQASKNVLGADYGMKGNSGIDKEWDEQAAFFADSLKGMNAAAVNGIELDDSGKAADTDLLSGVTVTISGMVGAADRALKN